MCLCLIEKRFKPNEKIRRAYKVFSYDTIAGKLTTPTQGFVPTMGKWASADDNVDYPKGKIFMADPLPKANMFERTDKIRMLSGRTGIDTYLYYPSGFHAYQLLEDAFSCYKNSLIGGYYQVREVLLRDTRVAGREYSQSSVIGPVTKGYVYVAKHMLVTKDNIPYTDKV